jgi:hypothetical protein
VKPLKASVRFKDRTVLKATLFVFVGLQRGVVPCIGTNVSVKVTASIFDSDYEFSASLRKAGT